MLRNALVTHGATQQEMISALQWYIDHGVSDCVLDDPINRFDIVPEVPKPAMMSEISASAPQQLQESTQTFLGKSDAYDEAVKLAKAANSLGELSNAIAGFDGIAIKKTASNMVFADGNPKAEIMIIGEAPAADEDRQGVPFSGASGNLLDKILACIDLSRKSEDSKKSVYISNILNWRPPGNRSPSSAEIEVSLPFIERHIQLIEPKIIVLCGGVAAKSLLSSSDSISRLRKKWHDYKPQTQALGGSDISIPAIATYHPSYLLSTPVQKKLVWEDMLNLQKQYLPL